MMIAGYPGGSLEQLLRRWAISFLLGVARIETGQMSLTGLKAASHLELNQRKTSQGDGEQKHPPDDPLKKMGQAKRWPRLKRWQPCSSCHWS